MKMNVEIDNLTEPQVIALEDMFRTWIQLGKLGMSRYTAFYADGDGNFRPKITVNEKEPEFTNLINRDDLWKSIKIKVVTKTTGEEVWEGDSAYIIDFDDIAWALRKEKSEIKK